MSRYKVSKFNSKFSPHTGVNASRTLGTHGEHKPITGVSGWSLKWVQGRALVHGTFPPYSWKLFNFSVSKGCGNFCVLYYILETQYTRASAFISYILHDRVSNFLV